MSLSLRDLLPDFNFAQDAGDLESIIDSVLQPVLDLLLLDLAKFKNQKDPDLAEENAVDGMLRDLGNPFDIVNEHTIVEKRKLLKILVEIYRTKGTSSGMTDAIRTFTGIDGATVVSPATVEGFLIGWNVLGDDENMALPPNWQISEFGFLGSSPSFAFYSFEVQVPRVLTEAERDVASRIVRLMKPAHTHFVGFIEPEADEPFDHVDLGYSALYETGAPIQGDEFQLH